MPRPKKPEAVFRILREYDDRFELWDKRGKGSERIIYHPNIDGRPQQIPMTFHRGKDVKTGLLSAIIRRFKLPKRLFG